MTEEHVTVPTSFELPIWVKWVKWSASDDEAALYPIWKNREKPLWTPGNLVARAECAFREHEAPADDCSCGLYATRDLWATLFYSPVNRESLHGLENFRFTLIHVDSYGVAYNDGLVIRSEYQTLIAAFKSKGLNREYPRYQELSIDWLYQFVPPVFKSLYLRDLICISEVLIQARAKGESYVDLVLEEHMERAQC